MRWVRATVRFIWHLPRRAGMGLIRVYQWTLSPLLGPRCRYYPSCSHYGYTAVERYGLLRGSALTGWRILRCNPWSDGGIDDVPEVGQPLFRQPKEADTRRRGGRVDRRVR